MSEPSAMKKDAEGDSIPVVVVDFADKEEPSPSTTENEPSTHPKPPQTDIVMEAKGPISFLFITYLNQMMATCLKRPLEIEDIPLLKAKDTAVAFSDCIKPYFAQVTSYLQSSSSSAPASTSLSTTPTPSSSIPKPALLPFIFKQYGHYFYISVLLKFISVGCTLYIPFILQAIIRYLQGLGDDTTGVPFANSGLGLCFLMFAVSLIQAIADPLFIQMNRNFQFNITGILRTAIFEKSLRLSNKSSKDFNEGRIMTMVNVDVELLSMSFLQATAVVTLPFQLVFTIYFLIRLIGVSIYPSGIIIVVTLVTMLATTSQFMKFTKEYMTSTDSRLKRLRELLMGIRVIKLRAGEDFQVKSINAARQKQLDALKWALFYISIILIFADLPATIMPLVSFLLYSRERGGVIDPAFIFPALIYFSGLFMPLQQLPMSIGGVLSGYVGLKRLEDFLRSPERSATPSAPSDSPDAIIIRDATFKWEAESPEEVQKGKKKSKKNKEEEVKESPDLKVASADNSDSGSLVPIVEKDAEKSSIKKDGEPLFTNLSLTIPKGKLTAVVGVVGSGKSSLLSAILGEMTKLEGSVFICGTPALCQQHPWLLSQTFEQNILFGLPKDQQRFDAAVAACGLNSDVDQLEHGFDTQIGEKGISLSGGQKARVALARAVYDSNADIFLLDDPLAALDARVGRMVFENCIVGLLNGKTRVLITHQLHVLPDVDRIVVLKNGEVAEQGSFDELMATDGVLKEMMKDHKLDDKSDEEPTETDNTQIPRTPTPSMQKEVNAKEPTPSKKPKSKMNNLIAEEERQRGSMSFEVIKEYVRICGGTPILVAFTIMMILQTAGMFTRSVWLVWWGDQKFSNLSNQDYFNGYAVIGVVGIVAIISCSLMIAISGYFAGRTMHNEALAGLIKAPMSFFDSQPIGRIINRMSKDVEGLDREIWLTMLNFFFMIASLIAMITSLAYTTPYILILFAALSVIYYVLLKYYRNSNRELKRIAAIEKSPLNAHISECLSGVVTVRAFGAEQRVILALREYLDRSNKANFAQLSIRVWLGIRIQLFSCFVVLFICLFGILSPNYSPSLMGLAIQSTSDLSIMLWMLTAMTAQLEADFVSLERLLEYSKRLPDEGPRELPSDPKAAQWPKSGVIEVKDLQVKYASSTDPVIKGLNLSIRAGEKIGIVGRTGSGKSTFLTALFRLVEPHAGSITIDGKDITTLGLKTLRSRLQIIPQEPVLFTGTVRSNIDPENLFDDSKIWAALEMVGLKEFVTSKDTKLEFPIEENGNNLSVGQRQLLILARALCVNPKILVMDEASSSVDGAADSLIQASIQEHFGHATVISIAHRLNTIANFDRVVVMDKGVAVEFDSPANLLRVPDGQFRQLVDATGVANARLIQEIAEDHERLNGQ
ncbi:Multidrug resistance-associated protein 1 [Phlyctochytrium planicorne]|nr:Multidrug resistance-associated protein 1 [Phlyctochytrium planicorne]